ncbi:DUF3502 domain-containing protein [Paenibacillus swuensis]|nr:DUF3502 domain-containing protein [Paenibacillus swuensis]
MFKLHSLCLALLMVTVVILSGCSGGNKESKDAANNASNASVNTGNAVNTNTETAKEPNPLDTTEEKKLSIYLLGDAQADAGIVYDEVNKKLKSDLNATLDVKYIPWADWQSKYNLVFAAGEDFDGIYTGSWTGYAEQVTKGGFMEITEEMLQTYAPDYYKILQEKYPTALSETKINGKSYMLPAFDVWADSTMVTIRGDLREKYGLSEVKTIDDFDNYLMTVAKNEKTLVAFNASGQDMFQDYMNLAYYVPNNMMPVNTGMPYLAYKLGEEQPKIVNVLDDPAYRTALERAKKLADAGAIPKSVLTNKTRAQDTWKAGKTAAVPGGLAVVNGRQNEADSDHPEWKAETIDLWPDAVKAVGPGNGSGFAIHAGSKNWERLLMAYNLLITDKAYQTLTQVGIEGKHYTEDNGVYIKGPDGDKFANSSNCPWGWQNKDLMLRPGKGAWIRMDYDQKWRNEGKAISPVLSAMNFVDTDVKNELSAINNMIQTRGYILSSGKPKNIDSELQKLQSELKSAGIEKIQKAMQTQADAFIASR